jgi:trans-2,3-dihydro-3-hydroxyanthranilate isomerase
MKEHQIGVVDTVVFASGPRGGNRCPVIPDADRLADHEMQSLARKFGLDTAFILRPDAEGADIRIRYFVPDHEMGVSGHATIAAVTVALSNQAVHGRRLRVQTSTGLFDLEWTLKANQCVVTLEQNEPVFGPTLDAGVVACALKIGVDCIVSTQSPIQVVSASRPKIMVPVRDWQVLDGLKPDMEALWKLCEIYGATGLYPFTRHTDKRKVQAEARQFPVRAGFPEDAATGVAAAALGAYLTRYDRACKNDLHEYRIAQGYAMGAPSSIETLVECAGGRMTRTAIRGSAQIVARQRVRIQD